jgi:hypothetical protein
MAGNGIILHHPAMSKEAITRRSGRSMVQYFRDIHVNRNGWRDIGYHYIFNLDWQGQWRLYSGRPDDQSGAHAPGYNHWIGICVCIDWPEGNLASPVMYESLVEAMREVADQKRFELNEATIKGHNSVYATKCPGKLDVNRIIDMVTSKEEIDSFGPKMNIQFPDGPITGYNYNNRSYIRVTDLEKLGYEVTYDAEQNAVIVSE